MGRVFKFVGFGKCMARKFKFYALKLCLICVIVFVVQFFIPEFTELFVLNENSLNGEVWRFVSSIFLHGSAPHLLYNLFALALFGSILEKLIRGKKFLLVFFLSGIVANVVAVNFYDSSLGASGAIMGILGVLAVIKPLMMVWAFGMVMPMFVAAILWVVGDFLGIFMPDKIGHIAHLSGIGVGLFLGLIFRAKKRRNNINRVRIPESYARAWEDRFMRN